MGVLRRSMYIWPEEKRLDNVHHKWCLIWDPREWFILLEKMSGHWAEEAWVSPGTEDVVDEVGVRLRTEEFCESLTDPGLQRPFPHLIPRTNLGIRIYSSPDRDWNSLLWRNWTQPTEEDKVWNDSLLPDYLKWFHNHICQFFPCSGTWKSQSAFRASRRLMNYLLLSPGIQFSLSRAILPPFPATDRVPLTCKCKGQVDQMATLCANSPSSTPEQQPCSSYSPSSIPSRWMIL